MRVRDGGQRLINGTEPRICGMRASGPAADCKQKLCLLLLKGLDDYQCFKQKRTIHASEHAYFKLI